ncbi:MAG: GGDEF domain-containing protein, partial [Rhizobiales bacterium]|nr:GGDEF domain-containing protein [Rhizobacter sp.]
MSELIDRLAELTGQRDRDVLDVTLVGALRDILGTVSVSIYRSIGEAGQERWLTRARLVGDSAAAEADPAWFELEDLPRLADHPVRLSALREDRVIAVRGATHHTLFPVSTDREVIGVLEIETARGITSRQRRTVSSILRIFRNFQGLLDYSERDTLTGLLNRKTFDESFLKATSA